MKKTIKNIMLGITMGCTIFVFIRIVLSMLNNNIDVGYNFVKNAICSMAVGIGFTVPTIIYNNPKLSRTLQIIISLGIGFIIFGAVSVYAKWVPIIYGIGGIIAYAGISIFFALAIWVCFYLYYKYEANEINQKLKERQKK